jgi:hypothetical protein
LTAVIVFVFLSSSLAWTTRRRRHHVDTVTVTSLQIFVGRHRIDLIPSVYWQGDRRDSRPKQTPLFPSHLSHHRRRDDHSVLVKLYKAARLTFEKP